MPILYHLQHSPFSRRARLALAHKGVDVELREGAQKPEWRAEAQRLAPTRTLPVFVDGVRAIGDSTVLSRWLDEAYAAAPRLWPAGDDALAAFDVAAQVDVVVNHAADLGTRYYALREHAAWPKVRDEMLGRVASALEALATRAGSLGRTTIAASGWSAADIWLFTAVVWLEGLPARVKTSPNAAQIATFGIQVPAPLSRWADGHRTRGDVAALG